MRLANKVALITGAGTGQGKAAALLFAREGAKIVILEIDETRGKEAADSLARQGGEAVFVKTDVASEKEVKQAIAAGLEAFGKLDILYNNAGVLWPTKDLSVTETDEEQWDRVMAVNLKGPLWVCKHGIPELIRQGGGSIINTGSIGAYQCGATQRLAAYYASKGALTTLTRCLAAQYAGKGIRANVIQPGMVDTPMQSHWDEKGKKDFAAKIPLARWALAEDIAQCALFLASDESSYITGSAIVVDGGYLAQL